MSSYTRAALAVPAMSLAALVAAAAPATAADGSAQADLKPVVVNGVEASGMGMAEINGTMLSFTLAAQGLLADAPHAAHIHFGADARHECPTEADNAGEAGEGESIPEAFLTTTEGAPAYGGIVVSLTRSGDTSPDSALAVDRFGVGDDFEYSRGDVQVSQDVADAITSGQAVVVVHGVDHNDSGTYDAGERGMSELDPSLPGEATDPAICGVLQASQMSGMPAGGVDTGAGSTSGYENVGLLGAGALALVGGATLVVARRRASELD